MNWLFPPFEPDDAARARGSRFRRVSTRALIPNLITLLALCMGLTAIRMAIEERFEWAVAAIVVAAVLDSLDGQIARLLKSTSRFGAELDSLADFVNFGVAPAVLLYNWSLVDLRSAGWIGVLAFSLCCGLRLARFNVALDRPVPAWMSKFFVGMPAPAGAITLLLPLYIDYLGLLPLRGLSPLILVYCGAIAFLMVSRVPTFSGKAIGMRVSRDLVMPLFVMVVLFFAFLLSFPWLTLATGTVAYLGSIPVSLWRYREFALAAEAHRKPAEPPQAAILPPKSDEDDDRPAKLH
ncbi:MAG TPA: CDP-diacylglycerol--serine O-phosphatidyltransferase [Hyphomicrobiales bacterium]|nr:CDP-diacylglycerol--serine O-phosphatidyltransferase [Hyphomicrobiales bacterium]